jgi:hypothetical protein
MARPSRARGVGDEQQASFPAHEHSCGGSGVADGVDELRRNVFRVQAGEGDAAELGALEAVQGGGVDAVPVLVFAAAGQDERWQADRAW